MTQQNNQESKQPARDKKRGPGVFKILQSVLAGAIGVQSNKRREEDFAGHSPLPYIIAGIIFTVGFVVTIVVVVQLVLAG